MRRGAKQPTADAIADKMAEVFQQRPDWSKQVHKTIDDAETVIEITVEEAIDYIMNAHMRGIVDAGDEDYEIPEEFMKVWRSQARTRADQWGADWTSEIVAKYVKWVVAEGNYPSVRSKAQLAEGTFWERWNTHEAKYPNGVIWQ